KPGQPGNIPQPPGSAVATGRRTGGGCGCLARGGNPQGPVARGWSLRGGGRPCRLGRSRTPGTTDAQATSPGSAGGRPRQPPAPTVARGQVPGSPAAGLPGAG